MVLQSVQAVTDVFAYILDMFVTMLEATGSLPFYLFMLGILFSVTYLVSPFTVSPRSDTAKRNKRDDGDGG